MGVYAVNAMRRGTTVSMTTSLSGDAPFVKSIDRIGQIHMMNLVSVDLNLLVALEALIAEAHVGRAARTEGVASRHPRTRPKPAGNRVVRSGDERTPIPGGDARSPRRPHRARRRQADAPRGATRPSRGAGVAESLFDEAGADASRRFLHLVLARRPSWLRSQPPVHRH